MNAAEPPPPLTPSLGRPHAVFRWGAGRFALDVAGVQEVVVDLELTPLPRGGVGWLGVGNLRGEILPAVSLRPWFPDGNDAAGTIFLILRTPLGKLALAVNGFEQIAVLDPAAVAPAEDDAPDFAFRHWRQGTPVETIHHVDADRLARSFLEQTQANFSAAP